MAQDPEEWTPSREVEEWTPSKPSKIPSPTPRKSIVPDSVWNFGKRLMDINYDKSLQRPLVTGMGGQSVLPDLDQPDTYVGGFAKSLYDDFVKPFGTGEGIIGSSIPGKKPVIRGKPLEPAIPSPVTAIAKPDRRLTDIPLPAGVTNRRVPEMLPSDKLITDIRYNELLGKLGGRQGTNQPQALDAVTAPPSTPEVLESQFRRADLNRDAKPLRKKSSFSPNLNLGNRLKSEKGEVKLPDFSESEFIKKVKSEIEGEKGSSKTLNTISMTGNTMRASMAGADLSAPLRQGVTMIHKKEFWNNLKPMVKMFKDEKFFKQEMDKLVKSPTFKMKKDSGLQLTGITDGSEERYLSTVAENIPILGKIVRAGDRGYTGFLNKLRSDSFDSLIKDATASGLVPGRDKELAKNIANYINVYTGRGGLGKAGEQTAKLLNATIFSPRLVSSRARIISNALNPQTYLKSNEFVRREQLKSTLALGSFWATAAGLAKLGGAEVNMDPTNSDFAKIKIGNTRVDILGGIQQYGVAAARLISGKRTSSTSGRTTVLGEGFAAPTRKDVAYDFFESKEAPLVSFATTLLEGKDYKGDKLSIGKEVADRFLPMVVQDLREIIKHDPWNFPLIAPAVLGASVQTYPPTGMRLRKPSLGNLRLPTR